MLITNAFSINMIGLEDFLVRFTRIDAMRVIELLTTTGIDSAVGHMDTAVVLSNLLHLNIVANRRTLKLTSGDKAIVAQYCGARMPDGAAKLPEGASFKWVLIEVC